MVLAGNVLGGAVAGGYTEGAKVYNSAALVIPTATWTILTFDSERYDTDDIHSIATNTDRLTCKTAGKYLITVTFRWDNNSSGTIRRALIHWNGTNSIAQVSAPPSPLPVYQIVTTIYELAVNEYVNCLVYHNRGANLNINVQVGDSPEFMMQRIG